MIDDKQAKITDFKPDLHNANKGTEKGAIVLDDSVKLLGLGRSILVDKHGNIIAGNKTQETAVANGLEDAIVIETDGSQLVVVKRTDIDLYSEDDDRARLLAIYDNLASQVNLDWDPVNLDFVLQNVQSDSISMQTALSELATENDLYFGDAPELLDPEPQIDRAEELNEKWRVKTGDLWQIGEHKLLCGDSTNADDVKRLMGDEKAILCVTSPPYWVKREYENETGEIEIRNHIDLVSRNIILALIDRPHIAINTGTSLANWHSDMPRHVWLMIDWWRDSFFEKEFYLRNLRIWAKEGGYIQGLTPQQDVVHHGYEFIGSFTASKPRSQNRIGEGWAISGLWTFGAETRDMNHSAPYPIELPSRFVKLYTDDNDLVFEPYGGSGTTMVACEQLNRKCRMIEIAPKYCAVILERLSEMNLTPELL